MRFLFLHILLLPIFLFGQNTFHNRDAFTLGTSSSSVAVSQALTFGHNPAIIPLIEGYRVNTSYIAPYLIKEFAQKNISIFFPEYKTIHANVGINHYGYSLYNSARIFASLGKKLTDNIYIGLTFNYHRVSISTYPSANAFSVNLGSFFKINEYFTVGIALNNPFLANFGDEYEYDSVASFGQVGLAYNVNDFTVSTDAMLSIDNSIDVSMAIRYQLHENINLKTGVATYPIRNNFGVDLSIDTLIIALGYEYNSQAGHTSGIGLSYAW